MLKSRKAKKYTALSLILSVLLSLIPGSWAGQASAATGDLEVTFGAGTHIGNLSYNYEHKDIAVLDLPSPAAAKLADNAYSYLEMRTEAVKHGEAVFALGYPLKNTSIITEGIINTPAAEINGRSRILTSAQVVSGMSGGPLMDAHGRLAGIISGSLRTMNNIHLIINMDDLRSILPAAMK
ncbi:S1 family peptidase [Paenibacillus ihuae]|uniref:S1 family peptidase n=1 Tax=Paenibacillus ihuae TaxID=1232431 RepID=UPI0006D55794|nr:serine protease [Paenibacillus ihuae]